MRLSNKIYLKAYLADNFGDDLFLKILLERYPDEKFIVYDNRNYKNKFSMYKNVLFIHPFLWRIYNVLSQKLRFRKYKLDNIIASLCKATVLIGGSLFIEPNIIDLRNDLIKRKPFYILGINFGPFQSEKYLKYYKEYFKNKTDVCFRDRASFELFSEISNVRYNADIVCSLPLEQVRGDGVFVSVMSLEDCHPELIKYQNRYEDIVIDNIKKYIQQGKEITLCSFCALEGDVKAIERIVKRIENDRIKKIEYYQDIDIILRAMSSAEIIIGTRFHSIVLGVILQKEIIPISYSNKTNNFLIDIGFDDIINDIRCMDEILISGRVDINIIKRLQESAEKQFIMLDEYLK